eukprot:m.34114 g.34114  ORF g.34114 m.34114 type:complete len:56 (+) comp10629_c0_seq2:89-256(+)
MAWLSAATTHHAMVPPPLVVQRSKRQTAEQTIEHVFALHLSHKLTLLWHWLVPRW